MSETPFQKSIRLRRERAAMLKRKGLLSDVDLSIVIGFRRREYQLCFKLHTLLKSGFSPPSIEMIPDPGVASSESS